MARGTAGLKLGLEAWTEGDLGDSEVGHEAVVGTVAATVRGSKKEWPRLLQRKHEVDWWRHWGEEGPGDV